MQAEYDILGVERGATRAEITTAYRRAAMRYHPDRNPDDPDAKEKFQEIERAYRLLKQVTPRLRFAAAAGDAAAADAATAGKKPAPPKRTEEEILAGVNAWRAERDKANAERAAYERRRREEAQAREEKAQARSIIRTPAFALCAALGGGACWWRLQPPLDIIGLSVLLIAAFLLTPREPKTYFALSVAMLIKNGVPLYFVGVLAWLLWKAAVLLLSRAGVIF